MEDRFLGGDFGDLSCLFWCTVLHCLARLPIYPVNYWTVVSGTHFLTLECLSVTLVIDDLWQYCICCIISGVIRCSLFMVLYLCCMCQCGLYEVLWSHIGILMRILASEPRSTAESVLPTQCSCGTILLTLILLTLILLTHDPDSDIAEYGQM